MLDKMRVLTEVLQSLAFVILGYAVYKNARSIYLLTHEMPLIMQTAVHKVITEKEDADAES